MKRQVYTYPECKDKRIQKAVEHILRRSIEDSERAVFKKYQKARHNEMCLPGGFLPPPWPLTAENEDKTFGWLAFQDWLTEED